MVRPWLCSHTHSDVPDNRLYLGLYIVKWASLRVSGTDFYNFNSIVFIFILPRLVSWNQNTLPETRRGWYLIYLALQCKKKSHLQAHFLNVYYSCTWASIPWFYYFPFSNVIYVIIAIDCIYIYICILFIYLHIHYLLVIQTLSWYRKSKNILSFCVLSFLCVGHFGV